MRRGFRRSGTDGPPSSRAVKSSHALPTAAALLSNIKKIYYIYRKEEKEKQKNNNRTGSKEKRSHPHKMLAEQEKKRKRTKERKKKKRNLPCNAPVTHELPRVITVVGAGNYRN